MLSWGGDALDRDEAFRFLSRGSSGVGEWNSHRQKDADIPALSGVNLNGAYLEGADLRGACLAGAYLNRAYLEAADLRRANLAKAYLCEADLREADLRGVQLEGASVGGASFRGADLRKSCLRGAYFRKADLREADLREANLREADLDGVNFERARLEGSDLRGANLEGAYLGRANLEGASLAGCRCRDTTFTNLDLSGAVWLESVGHGGPSTVGVDTILRSRGKIPEAILRGCGLSPWEVLGAKLYDPALTPPQFCEIQVQILDAWTQGKDMINGCFISYSSKDAKFAEKLRTSLMAAGVNVWLDNHDLLAGDLQDQVWRAIQVQHVAVLILSEHSIASDWVENELDMARRKEKEEKRPVLCPIALDDTWKSKVDSDDGPGDPERQLWRTLMRKKVLDFSARRTGGFDVAFEKLLRGLKLNYGPK